MRLISSVVALKVVVALSATAALTLSELARALRCTPSAVQRALAILSEDAVVERGGPRSSAYALASSKRASHVAAIAVDAVPLEAAATLGARANRAVEFLAREPHALVTVFAAGSTAVDQARMARFLDALATRDRLTAEYLDHDDVRRRLVADSALRSRVARARILYGRLDRSFPDRSRHGLGAATPLHWPHRSVHLPSASTLRRIARRHGVGGLRLFGSAVRSDFRPDSDIDILLRFRDGVHPTLRSLLELEGALETVFARDVDLVREELVGADARERIEAEAVSLL